jgi:hypothetical protein
MPKNLDEEAQECFRRADGCAQEGGVQTDQKLKEGLFELERCWQFLARGYDPATVLSCWTAGKIWRSLNYGAEAG